MRSRESRTITPVVSVLAVVLLSSCGGSLGDSVTGPTPTEISGDPSDLRAADVQLDDLDLTGLSAASTDKVLICHKGMDLWVPPEALGGHLGHGDTLGSCTPATCPCFSQADIEAAAAGCSTLTASCPATYSLGLFCAPGGTGGTIGNIGYWEAVVGQGTCSWTVWDPVTGDAVTQTLAVDAGQFEACRTAITTSSPYPASCPH